MLPYFMPYINAYEELQNVSNKLKQKAIDEYKIALEMPRKKKKKAKKSALLLYSIACWGENKLTF
jgi:uncharacterized membrane protein YbaN (DUF454 family)